MFASSHSPRNTCRRSQKDERRKHEPRWLTSRPKDRDRGDEQREEAHGGPDGIQHERLLQLERELRLEREQVRNLQIQLEDERLAGEQREAEVEELEGVDLASDPRVFAILDDGCNRTCHSTA